MRGPSLTLGLIPAGNSPRWHCPQVYETSGLGARCFDAGKKINGRKRHILVDTLGLLLVVLVTVSITTQK